MSTPEGNGVPQTEEHQSAQEEESQKQAQPLPRTSNIDDGTSGEEDNRGDGCWNHPNRICLCRGRRQVRKKRKPKKKYGKVNIPWSGLPTTYEPCVHLHFKTKTQSREELSQQEYADMLATPKGYIWQGQPTKKALRLRRRRCRRKTRRMKRQKKQRGEAFAADFMTDMWQIMNPELQDKMVELLTCEFGMKEDEADGVVKRAKTCKCSRKKKKKPIISIRNSWIQEFSKICSDKITEYIVAMLTKKRTPRAKKIAETILSHLCDITGERTSIHAPKTRIHRLMVLLADRLAMWLDDMFKESKKPRKHIEEEEEGSSPEDTEPTSEETTPKPSPKKTSKEPSPEKTPSVTPKETRTDLSERPTDEKPSEDVKSPAESAEKEQPPPEQKPESPPPEAKSRPSEPKSPPQETSPPKPSPQETSPLPESPKEPAPLESPESPKEPAPPESTQEPAPPESIQEPAPPESTQEPAPPESTQEPAPPESTQEPAPPESTQEPEDQLTSPPAEEKVSDDKEPPKETTPPDETTELPPEDHEPSKQESKAPSEVTEGKGKLEEDGTVSHPLDEMPPKESIKESEKEPSVVAIKEEKPSVVVEKPSVVVVSEEDVIRSTPGTTFAVKRGGSHYEVSKISSLTIAEKIALARHKVVPVRGWRAPKTVSPVNSATVKDWALWAKDVAGVAEEWNEWIETTIRDVQRKHESVRPKEGETKRKLTTEEKLDWEKWRQNREKELMAYRVENQKMQYPAQMWNKKVQVKSVDLSKEEVTKVTDLSKTPESPKSPPSPQSPKQSSALRTSIEAN